MLLARIDRTGSSVVMMMWGTSIRILVGSIAPPYQNNLHEKGSNDTILIIT